MEFVVGDALATPLGAISTSAPVDLAAIPVGRREDGSPWSIGVAGTHVLIAGVTGAGKGSVLWSLIRGLSPAVRSGTVQLWVIDPKGGIEFAAGRDLFARFEGSDFEAMADTLEDAVILMRRRADSLAGRSRRHVPTFDEPQVVIIVDELATLTAYLPDRKLRDRIAQALAVLLTQGRAVGLSVVASLQDPRKDVVAFRNLFPTKVALRLDESAQVDMVLGDGARASGARADRISDRTPGVGYVKVDGQRDAVRVRAAFVSDEDIAALTASAGAA
ncbi:MAG: FtsK/SpoIIIE domain-containing protein [Desertimonas sp.]